MSYQGGTLKSVRGRTDQVGNAIAKVKYAIPAYRPGLATGTFTAAEMEQVRKAVNDLNETWTWLNNELTSLERKVQQAKLPGGVLEAL